MRSKRQTTLDPWGNKVTCDYEDWPLVWVSWRVYPPHTTLDVVKHDFPYAAGRSVAPYATEVSFKISKTRLLVKQTWRP